MPAHAPFLSVAAAAAFSFVCHEKDERVGERGRDEGGREREGERGKRQREEGGIDASACGRLRPKFAPAGLCRDGRESWGFSCWGMVELRWHGLG